MTESRRELLKQLHDLERRADAVRQRLTDDLGDDGVMLFPSLPWG